MKITILNGNQEPSSFDSYLEQLASTLKNSGYDVSRLDLRDLPLRPCVGCPDRFRARVDAL